MGLAIHEDRLLYPHAYRYRECRLHVCLRDVLRFHVPRRHAQRVRLLHALYRHVRGSAQAEVSVNAICVALVTSVAIGSLSHGVNCGPTQITSSAPVKALAFEIVKLW